MSNRWIVHCLLLTLPLIDLVGASCQGEDSSQPPHVLILFPDQWRRQAFSRYGDPNVQTPNIDRMAKEGVLSQTAWCTPICTPHRET